MLRSRFGLALALVLAGTVPLAPACGSDGSPTEEAMEGETPTDDDGEDTDTLPPTQRTETFAAELSGAKVVPNPVSTDATGSADFELAADGTSLSYALSVHDIEDVFAAHIHLGAADENGEIAVDLFDGDAPAPDGVLAEGTITDADVDASEVTSLAGLADVLRRSEAYVNVHTAAYPGGEIRGQIEPTDGGG